jgi:hypothetical protein
MGGGQERKETVNRRPAFCKITGRRTSPYLGKNVLIWIRPIRLTLDASKWLTLAESGDGALEVVDRLINLGHAPAKLLASIWNETPHPLQVITGSPSSRPIDWLDL